MSEQNDLPRVFEKTHSKFKTPYVSIIVTSGAMLLLTLQSSFLSAVAIATITRLLVYVTTCLALPIFRRKSNMPKAPFSARFGTVAAILSLGLIVWLLTNVDYSKEGLPTVVAAVVGFAIYFGYRIYRKSSG
jgi:amino acid transporter